MKILVIEDDKDVAQSLRKGLSEHDFDVDIVNDGLEGLTAARQGVYQALIVDRMLPGLDGLSLIKQLRENNDLTPALLLTALSNVDDRVEGLDAGADDYLGKPFAFAELLARLRVLVKRQLPFEKQTKVQIGDLMMDKLSRDVYREGKKLYLQPREFELLLYFCNHVGQPVTREMLLKEVWGLEFDPQTNIVDVHISRLRQKVDKDFRDPLIRTVRGVGYVFGTE